MKTCLVADDSTVIRKIARGILQDLDFEAIEASDGEKALEVCRPGLPEVILLDWNMPVTDGYEFLVHLRKASGADEYIMKPFDRDIVAAKSQEAGSIHPTTLA
jgi:two-component system chemotaxis response regulator CheY